MQQQTLHNITQMIVWWHQSLLALRNKDQQVTSAVTDQALHSNVNHKKQEQEPNEQKQNSVKSVQRNRIRVNINHHQHDRQPNQKNARLPPNALG